MSRIIKNHDYAVEIEFNSGERAILTNSGNGGVKLKKMSLGLFLKTVWICDNYHTLEKLTKKTLDDLDPMDKMAMNHLELISISLLDNYLSIEQVKRDL